MDFAAKGNMMILLFITVMVSVIEMSTARICKADNKETFSYHGSTNGPDKWPRLFPTCDGDEQSPVAIKTKKVDSDDSLPQLEFVGYHIPITNAEVTNNGHTVLITPQDDVDRGIYIDDEEYILQQFHFHFGSADNPGAEHTVDGVRHTMEIHFVHQSENGDIAVVALLVQAKMWDNPALMPITTVLSDVAFKGDSTGLKSSLNLSKLLPKNSAFYQYAGSLTTPTCNEGVSWIVLQSIQYIGSQQLNSFLRLSSVRRKDADKSCRLSGNYRPLQPLNGRVIYASQ